eukprot:279421_1
MLDDYHHLLSKHQNSIENIKSELIEKYGFSQCLVKDCQFIQRHFDESRKSRKDTNEIETNSDVMVGFYEREYDSLHFNLFHLYDVGYRFKKRENDFKNKNDND